MPSTLLWFRRDLRLNDLPPLLEAAADGAEVLGCFVLDPGSRAAPGGDPEPIVDHATERTEALRRYGQIG
jgi:deoxyribodipyrimidine photolyase